MGTEINRSALEQYFVTLDGVVVAYLFGSHARGQAGPLSDVDMAVLFDDSVSPDLYSDKRLQVIGGLTDILHTTEVDVVVLNQAPLALSYRVVRDGVVLYCRYQQVMIEFIADTVTRYLDFKPVLERHERAILERARKGELLHGYNPHRGALERYRRLRQRLAGAAKSDV